MISPHFLPEFLTAISSFLVPIVGIVHRDVREMRSFGSYVVEDVALHACQYVQLLSFDWGTIFATKYKACHLRKGIEVIFQNDIMRRVR